MKTTLHGIIYSGSIVCSTREALIVASYMSAYTLYFYFYWAFPPTSNNEDDNITVTNATKLSLWSNKISPVTPSCFYSEVLLSPILMQYARIFNWWSKRPRNIISPLMFHFTLYQLLYTILSNLNELMTKFSAGRHGLLQYRQVTPIPPIHSYPDAPRRQIVTSSGYAT